MAAVVIGIDDKARFQYSRDQFCISPAVPAHAMGDLDYASRRPVVLPPAARDLQTVFTRELKIVAQILRRILGVTMPGSGIPAYTKL
jgi:hypothetical protein